MSEGMWKLTTDEYGSSFQMRNDAIEMLKITKDGKCFIRGKEFDLNEPHQKMAQQIVEDFNYIFRSIKRVCDESKAANLSKN